MKNLKPITLYNDKFLDLISWSMKVGGIALFPVCILRERYRDGNEYSVKQGKKILNHETIHFQQALELGVILFYILYVLEWVIKLPFYGGKAYYNISFEREAYDNDDDLTYLGVRKRYNWVKRILK